jgi:hypothetical protein
MTKQHKATPEQWLYAETCAPEDFAGFACIIELRARIEALEATQQPLVVNYAPAKPEQWEQRAVLIERLSRLEEGYDELLVRIEALEARQQPQQDKLDRLIALDRDDPANLLVERIATDADLCKVYNDAPDHCGPALRAVYDLGRQHGAAPIRSGPESPLVERVADAIAAQATSAGIVNDRPARAAILEVAAWLREQHGGDLVASTLLRREANP